MPVAKPLPSQAELKLSDIISNLVRINAGKTSATLIYVIQHDIPRSTHYLQKAIQHCRDKDLLGFYQIVLDCINQNQSFLDEYLMVNDLTN